MATFAEICAVLGRHYSASSAQTIARMALGRVNISQASLPGLSDPQPLLRELRRAMDLFSVAPKSRRLCVSQLGGLFGEREALPMQERFEVVISDESKIVTARTKARAMAAEIGFSRTDQVKVATIVSELARNIYHFAGRGRIIAARVNSPDLGISIEARDQGPGIADVESILAGAYRSRTGLGLGLIGCRNLSDEFKIDTALGKGTHIRVLMYR